MDDPDNTGVQGWPVHIALSDMFLIQNDTETAPDCRFASRVIPNVSVG